MFNNYFAYSVCTIHIHWKIVNATAVNVTCSIEYYPQKTTHAHTNNRDL